MKRIDVQASVPYTITVGRGLLSAVDMPESRRVLIYDEGLPGSLVEHVRRRLQTELNLAVPSGDACKTLDVYGTLLSRLAGAALARDAAVIGLGGGATTDLAGFVAASYLRGVAFYTLPTTLLAQVDAAVGGKTGLNLPEGKNLVGAFWNPRGVWCDVDTLESLPEHIFREGASEVFKHGLLTSGALCEQVLAPGFGASASNLAEVVADAVQVKVDVVVRDPTEQGERAFLNFGHTLAHALEAVTRHALSHGEAVGYGMHFAALLSRAQGGEDLTPLTSRFLSYLKPSRLPEHLTWEHLEPFIARDKKADRSGMRFVLLRRIGQPYLERLGEDQLRDVFNLWRAQMRAVVQ
ncbi:3-dehydroquinate synthase [Deinococcus peraridilitoris]|uniref:3-dehydroquinate synthase n=1 Tax=Deinococcus peraridilitoris (strain DSM 19664 / LMG 22246 / CIP 109416 / KR-200) TaxID=937777 RepID=L0A5T3_DEIPD|nr:3-dehydroquinate synthase [Deinococcus peraridilitoris]AFZ69243.1 3-dehydroquinate synthetase [Deinococcus peraridilitoris DSM 19664]